MLTWKQSDAHVKALVIHPQFQAYGGGELICLYVCKTLEQMRYTVTLATDVFEPETVDRIYGMGDVLRACTHFPMPKTESFRPSKWVRFSTLQRLLNDGIYARKVNRSLQNLDADIVFGTQSSIFTLKGKPLFLFLYDIIALFPYPASFYGETTSRKIGMRKRVYYLITQRARKTLVGKPPNPKLFLALSEKLRRDLSKFGYSNSIRIYPPCRFDFEPLEKHKTVVTVSRITPEKRLEMFLEIAKRLPQYSFYILARDSQEMRKTSPGYFEKVFENVPKNVSYLNSALKDASVVLQGSKVYLYCGDEPGIGIALMEAAGAGCVPVAYEKSGCGEVVKDLGVGYCFLTVEEAALRTRTALENSSWEPAEIRKKAERLFGPEKFEQTIRTLVQAL